MFEVRTVQASELCTLVEIHRRTYLCCTYILIYVYIYISYGDCATIGT